LEPFGYAPLEANACGTAVVALAEGGVRETMTNPACGVLIPSLDEKAFAHALLAYCDDLLFAAESGKKARAYVEQNWSKAAAAETLEREIKRVVEEGITAPR
jgi:glycosyltransferase involved in cell wall biosynthesis